MSSSKPNLVVNYLQSQFPDIAAEAYGWDPSTVTKGTSQKKDWKCKEGHIYSTRISHRTNSGSECPICSGQQVLKGFNDLQTKFPNIGAEAYGWDPTTTTAGSKQKRDWKCKDGHIYSSAVTNRTNGGTGCPVCSGRQLLAGFNDLQSQYPEIARDWNLTKNGELKPSEVLKGSTKRVWWQCFNHPDHEWYTSIRFRTNLGTGCPFCSQRQVLEGFNDFETANPKIAKEWHPIKNGDLKTTDVSRSSSQKVWWQCSKYPEHEWYTSIKERSNGSGCPICVNRKVIEGFNDLNTTEPELAKEWHPTRNGDLKPIEVTKSSGKKVWWQCTKHPDHEWDAKIADRSNGQGCPICSGQKVLEDFNDLQSLEPELAKEWHISRNGDLKPSKVTRRSGQKVWWQCSKYPDHEWNATVAGRSNGSGCPICIGQNVLEGFNDLKTTDPELATEWHPTRNGDFKPTDFTRGSRKKVWWQCIKYPDHEWDAVISSRSQGVGCPMCAEYGFNPSKDAWFYLMYRTGEQQLGITNNLDQRTQQHERSGWSLIDHTYVSSSGQKVLDTEKAFKKWLKDEIGLMEGTTENWSTTKMEVQSLAELKARSGIDTDLF